ncbi:MAG: hypothetical protein V4487_01730, partial [Chlamydiota bacterium]
MVKSSESDLLYKITNYSSRFFRDTATPMMGIFESLQEKLDEANANPDLNADNLKFLVDDYATVHRCFDAINNSSIVYNSAITLGKQIPVPKKYTVQVSATQTQIDRLFKECKKARASLTKNHRVLAAAHNVVLIPVPPKPPAPKKREITILGSAADLAGAVWKERNTLISLALDGAVLVAVTSCLANQTTLGPEIIKPALRNLPKDLTQYVSADTIYKGGAYIASLGTPKLATNALLTATIWKARKPILVAIALGLAAYAGGQALDVDPLFAKIADHAPALLADAGTAIGISKLADLPWAIYSGTSSLLNTALANPVTSATTIGLAAAAHKSRKNTNAGNHKMAAAYSAISSLGCGMLASQRFAPHLSFSWKA